MSKEDSGSAKEKSEETPARIRLAPSRNQKQRSKLKQVADENDPVEAAPVAPPPPPKAAPEAPRRVRLKRSGQMHEDLTAPIPPPPEKDEPEY